MRVMAGLLLVLMVVASAANAAVIVTIEESGGDVVATAVGSLDVSGATSCGPVTVPALLEFNAPDDYAYLIGPSGGAAGSACLGLVFSTAQSLYGSAFSTFPDSGTGGRFGVEVSASSQVYLPAGYVSGTAISASSTWAGQSLADLNLTPGTYLFDYGSDRITFNVVDPSTGRPGGSTAVPVMPLWISILMMLGVAGLGLRHMRRNAG